MPVDSKLKPEDLRIGNRIMYRNDMNVVLGIQSPSPQKEPYLDGKYLVEINPPDSFYVPIEDIEPILLSESTLKKCGFEINLTENAFWDENETILIGYKNGKFYYAEWGYDRNGEPIVDNKIELTSLSHFQNFYFYYTGSELTIQL